MTLLTTDAALRDLAPEWHALWRACPYATPFQSPAWLLAWWRVFGTGRPRVAVRRGADGALVGVLPLYELAGRLLPIGAGLTDLQDALLAPGLGAEAAGALLADVLAATALPCDLTDLPPEAVLRDAPPPPGWRCQTIAAAPCPVLRDHAVPARQRRKLRMARHRADRAGGWRVDDAGAAGLDALIRLHGASWQARGDGGVFADPRVAAFLRAGAPPLLAADAMRLATLRIGGEVVAAACVLPAPGRLLLWLGGWDPAAAQCSPGTLLIGALLEQAAAEGRREVNFLRGAEGYKYAWGATERPNVTRRFTPP